MERWWEGKKYIAAKVSQIKINGRSLEEVLDDFVKLRIY